MPVNLELKVKVKSHKNFKTILEKTGTENRGLLNQKDIYYFVPNGLLKLRIENGRESLIFYNRDEAGKNRWSDYKVVYFENRGSEKLFSSIFRIETVVQKKRKLYYLNNTRIHLDSVKELGSFLELETLVLNGKADARKRFNEVKKILKLNSFDEIKASYRDLMLNKKNNK